MLEPTFVGLIFFSRPTASSFAVPRNFFPYVDKIIHPKILKFLGRALPWPKLNYFMDLTETLKSKSRGVHEMKKKLLELGDDATVMQIGDGKDIISLLSAYIPPRCQIRSF